MGLYVSHREQKSVRAQKSRNLDCQKTAELGVGGSAAQATRTSLGESQCPGRALGCSYQERVNER